jgi:hypothetical protein
LSPAVFTDNVNDTILAIYNDCHDTAAANCHRFSGVGGKLPPGSVPPAQVATGLSDAGGILPPGSVPPRRQVAAGDIATVDVVNKDNSNRLPAP